MSTFADLKPADHIHRVPVDESDDFIRYDGEKCFGCGNCVKVCIVNIWKMDSASGRAQLADDYRSRCIECVCCAQSCPHDAIQFRYPKGGTGVVYEHG